MKQLLLALSILTLSFPGFAENVHGVHNEHEAKHEASHEAKLDATAAKADHGHEVVEGVSAEQALGWLKNGNKRYLSGTWRKDGKSSADRARLATGQHPHTIVLSCADSRVPPEHIFDQGLGEIFTVRVAGEALDSSVIASIEYAVEHLGSKHILVMGHTSCGAVKAALSAKDGKSVGSPSLDKLVADIKPRIGESKRDPASYVDEASRLNAEGVAKDLVSRSKIIKGKVEKGELKISHSLYHLDSGKVDF